MIDWKPIDRFGLPPEDEIVHTRINDGHGQPRNEALLRRQGNLWFFPDYSMYVYYRPTEWAPLTEEGKAQVRAEAERIKAAAQRTAERMEV